uniref:Uncharacterized protein n=1 Tax=Anguilla anguilla TaxID=7936 RepID=A0A0E9WJY6_ANGAN
MEKGNMEKLYYLLFRGFIAYILCFPFFSKAEYLKTGVVFENPKHIWLW